MCKRKNHNNLEYSWTLILLTKDVLVLVFGISSVSRFWSGAPDRILVIFKWQNNRMQKGIMKCGRWTNDVGIYVELVVIFWKSRKCFRGHWVYHLLWEKCKIWEQKYRQFININFMFWHFGEVDDSKAFTANQNFIDGIKHILVGLSPCWKVFISWLCDQIRKCRTMFG